MSRCLSAQLSIGSYLLAFFFLGLELRAPLEDEPVSSSSSSDPSSPISRAQATPPSRVFRFRTFFGGPRSVNFPLLTISPLPLRPGVAILLTILFTSGVSSVSAPRSGELIYASAGEDMKESAVCPKERAAGLGVVNDEGVRNAGGAGSGALEAMGPLEGVLKMFEAKGVDVRFDGLWKIECGPCHVSEPFLLVTKDCTHSFSQVPRLYQYPSCPYFSEQVWDSVPPQLQQLVLSGGLPWREQKGSR